MPININTFRVGFTSGLASDAQGDFVTEPRRAFSVVFVFILPPSHQTLAPAPAQQALVEQPNALPLDSTPGKEPPAEIVPGHAPENPRGRARRRPYRLPAALGCPGRGARSSLRVPLHPAMPRAPRPALRAALIAPHSAQRSAPRSACTQPLACLRRALPGASSLPRTGSPCDSSVLC